MIYARDLDRTGSLHICSAEDSGAIPHIRRDPAALAADPMVQAVIAAALGEAENAIIAACPTGPDAADLIDVYFDAAATIRALIPTLAAEALETAPPQGWDIRPEEARMRALLCRAHDAMSFREPDVVSKVKWDQLLADMAKEVGL